MLLTNHSDKVNQVVIMPGSSSIFLQRAAGDLFVIKGELIVNNKVVSN